MKATVNMNSPESNFDSSRISHAYIAAEDMAETISMASVCSERGAAAPCGKCPHCQKAMRRTHPDIVYINKPKDKREIAVEQIRDLKRDVIIVPNEAQKKAYIINDADLMNTAAQNAFLRVLEEPPAHTVFILKTGTPSELLPTIRSRCMLIRSTQRPAAALPPLSDATALESEISQLTGLFYSAIKKGSAAIADFMFRLDKLDKQQLAVFITAARSEAVARLKQQSLKPSKTASAIPPETLAFADHLLEQSEAYLDRNVNTGHISGFICASLIGKDN